MSKTPVENISANGHDYGYTNKAFQQDESESQDRHPTSTNGHVKKIWVTENTEPVAECEDERCGWRCWHPQFLQSLRTPKAALFWLCWAAAVQGMIVNGFVNVSISTLEKRYHLKSANTGLIAGFYDVAAVLCAIPVSYFGSRPGASKPRWLGWGILIMGIGSFVFTIPHLAAPPYDPVNVNVDPTINATSTLCEGEGNPSIAKCVSHTDDWLSSFKYVFILGSFLHGVGATPLYTLGVSYLDESVPVKMSSVYIGIFQTMAVIGPSFGYVFGGQFLTVFVDWPSANMEKLGIDKESSLWLGAWWVGFLISGLLAILVSGILLTFPAELPSTRELKKSQGEGRVSSPVTYNFGKLRALPHASFVLLKNMPYVFVTMAEAAEGFMMSGFAAFLPKIIESQFSVTPSLAAMLVGIVAIPAGGGGTFLGGWLMKKLKLECEGFLKMSFICSAACCILTCTLFLTCPNNPFAGVNVPYEVSPSLGADLGQLKLSSACNVDCKCTEMSFDPVCGADDTLYFSPCHAGCKISREINDKKIFTDCRCITNGTIDRLLDDFAPHLNSSKLSSSVTREPCVSKCNLLPLFLVVIFFVMLCIFLVVIPSLSATLRLVPDSHRSLALGVQWIIIRVLGTIPGPIIFGMIVDKTCDLWQTTCDGSGSCRSYDNTTMGRSVVAVGLGFRLLTTTFYAISLWLFRRQSKPLIICKN